MTPRFIGLSASGDSNDITRTRRPTNVAAVRVWLAFAVVSLMSCGGGNPSAPSGPGASPNLSGTFSGAGSDSTGAGQMTWQLTHTDRAVSGTATATTPLGTVAFTGTMAGTLSGTALIFTVTVPVGGVSGFPSCSVAVTGTATVTDTTITGAYAGTNSCAGPFTDGQLTLTKS